MDLDPRHIERLHRALIYLGAQQDGIFPPPMRESESPMMDVLMTKVEKTFEYPDDDARVEHWMSVAALVTQVWAASAKTGQLQLEHGLMEEDRAADATFALFTQLMLDISRVFVDKLRDALPPIVTA